MKRKANMVEAAPLPTCAAIGPEDMVLVACASGETFLIERNCALLSTHCRDVLLTWENAIRRVASQSKNNQSVCSPAATPTDVVAIGFPSSNCVGGGTAERSGGVRMLADLAENPNMTIPFMSAWDGAGASKPLASLDAGVQHLSITAVAERYQQRLDAATPTKTERPSSSKMPSSHGDRKGMMMVPKPVSPLAPLEDADGSLLYPVVQLTYPTPSLLEMSLAYASRKYKMDIDGDKMPTEVVPPVSAIVTGDPWEMIAAAVLTGM